MKQKKYKLIGVISCLILIMICTVGYQKRIEEPVLTAQNILRLSVTKEGETFFEIAYDPQVYKSEYDYWDITVPYESMTTVNTEVMYNLYEQIEKLDFSNVIDERKAFLKEYGLDKPSAAVTLDYFKEGQDSQHKETVKLLIGNKNEQKDYYAKIKGSNKIYLLSGEIIDRLLTINPFDYNLKIVGLVNIDTVDQVKVGVDGQELELLIKRDGEEERYYLHGQEVDKSVFTDLYIKLMSVLIKGEAEEEKTADLEDVPCLKVHYIRNTKGAEDVIVEMLPYDDQFLSARVNGKTFFVVSKEDVEMLVSELKTIAN